MASCVATTALNTIFAQPGLQADQKRIAGDAVERGKRLIEEKQARRWRECSGQCHALRLTAGEILWPASGEIGSTSKIQHFFHPASARGAIEIAQTVGNIGSGGEVRKERRLLRDQRGLAMAGRDA